MFSNISLLFKKYAVPSLFFVLGVILFIAGVSSKQDAMFMIASVMMFLAGSLSILYSSGEFKRTLLYIFGGVAGVAAIATYILSFKSVSDTAKYNADYELCRGKSIRNLDDVRYAQKAYMEKYGTYAADWETLVEYIKTGTVPVIDAAGVVPDRKITEEERDYLIQFGLYKKNQAIDFKMNEKEAYYLSKRTNIPTDLVGFKRDTIERSILEMKFMSKAYSDSRIKSGFGRFYADSLPYIPFTKGKTWKLETSQLVSGSDTIPTLKVNGFIPFAKIQGTPDEELSFGTLSANDLVGNWEDK
jgi:hypothetical protein